MLYEVERPVSSFPQGVWNFFLVVRAGSRVCDFSAVDMRSRDSLPGNAWFPSGRCIVIDPRATKDS
jgi:hypothetical protein